MYNAILVDDEALIRNAISSTIQWENYGFHLTATCQNAKQAVEILETDTPDLVITDICMPFMDGLELSKYIHENFPNIIVVIISGYNDFEYAKQAVHYHVQDYLLKPVTAAEFSDLLTKVKNVLDTQNKEQKFLEKIKHSYTENLSTLKSQFLSGLISDNTMSADYISEKLDEFQPNLKGPYYVCAILNSCKDISNEASSKTLSDFSVYSMAKEILEKDCLGEIFQDSSNRLIIYFSNKTSELTFKTAEEICNQIHEKVSDILGITLDIAIGKPVYSLHKLPQSYQSADSLMDNFFLTGGNKILKYSDFLQDIHTSSFNRTEWTNKILDFIKTNKNDELDFVLEQFIQTLRKNHVTKSKAILYIQSVVLSIMNFLDNTIFYSEEIFNKEQLLFDRLSEMEHLNDMGKALNDFCTTVSNAIHSKHEDYHHKQAMLALDFIENNYSECELSLADVCSHLAISTSRFSTVFKAETGETFVEALTRIRMEHAKDLLTHTSLKTYEIAEQIGYTDPHYFSIAFKKYTKMTPTEYIKAHKEEQLE